MAGSLPLSPTGERLAQGARGDGLEREARPAGRVDSEAWPVVVALDHLERGLPRPQRPDDRVGLGTHAHDDGVRVEAHDRVGKGAWVGEAIGGRGIEDVEMFLDEGLGQSPGHQGIEVTDEDAARHPLSVQPRRGGPVALPGQSCGPDWATRAITCLPYRAMPGARKGHATDLPHRAGVSRACVWPVRARLKWP
jgi:hypothetical protein